MNKQEYMSAGTSVNQVPRTHKALVKYGGRFKNFDNGAGKYLAGTNYLLEHGITNFRYDPYNLTDDINSQSLNNEGECDTSTVANVLNVIKEKEVQLEVIKRSYKMLKPGGICLISAYYNKSKEAGPTSNGWQWHKPLKWYLPIVKEVFAEAVIKNGLIVARKEF